MTNFTVKAYHNTTKNGTESKNYTYSAPADVMERLTAAAAAISAYVVSSMGANIPDAVYAYNKAVWEAAKNINSLSKLKKLACVNEFQLTSADLNFITSMIVVDDKTAAGRIKICGAKRALQILLQVLYCKQNGIEYTCKARTVKATAPVKATKSEKATKKPVAKSTKATTTTKPAATVETSTTAA